MVPLPDGCSERSAPAGGCPRQGPASVISFSVAQVSPQSPALTRQGCGSPKSRALRPRGSVLDEPSLSLRRHWLGARAPEGEVRTGAGTQCSLPLRLPRRFLVSSHPPTHTPPSRPGETIREGATTFRRLRSGVGKLQRVPARASRGLRAGRRGLRGQRVGDGRLQLLRRRPRRSCLPVVSQTLPGAPAGTRTFASPRSANSNWAVSEGTVGDAAVRGFYQAGEERGASQVRCQGRGFEESRRYLTFRGLARTRLWTLWAAK